MKRFLKRVRWGNVAWFVLDIIALIGLVWLVASVCDTNAHNMPFREGYGEFSEWNLFNFLWE